MLHASAPENEQSKQANRDISAMIIGDRLDERLRVLLVLEVQTAQK